MVREFRSSDKGMKVMTSDGDMVGTIDRASGNEAHVKPDSGLSQSIRRRLGWTKKGESTYRLQHAKVASIDDEGVTLKEKLD